MVGADEGYRFLFAQRDDERCAVNSFVGKFFRGRINAFSAPEDFTIGGVDTNNVVFLFFPWSPCSR